ncbi:MAG: N-acetylmannosamine-6-phosphate 2-epimerase [Alphaproteobacteria bacterium]
MTLKQLSGKLIVSCQPVPGGPMDRSDIIAAYGLSALNGGAAGLRIEGIENVRAVRAVTTAPVIGLKKYDLDDYPVRITPFIADIEALVSAGADIVAIDATHRPRPVAIAEQIEAIHGRGALVMADCATLADGRNALASGADLIGTTLSGYTGGKIPDAPDLDLLTQFCAITRFAVAEGRYHQPEQAAMAMACGAFCVAVGSAITRPEYVTGWFTQAVETAAGGNVKPFAQSQ